jgi:hypothetical protein
MRRHGPFVYIGRILSALETVELILEVGLDINNADTPSNMGSTGRPRASLRAFCEYVPRAKIFGADVDRRLLLKRAESRPSSSTKRI